MLKKGLLVFSIFSWILFAGFFGYSLYIKEQNPDLVAGIFEFAPKAEEVNLTDEVLMQASCIETVGKVVPKEGYIELKAPVNGIVENVFVKIGDFVKKGDLLYKIDDRKLKAQLKAENAKLAKATASLEFQKEPSKLALLHKQKEIDLLLTQKKIDEKMFFAFNFLFYHSAVSISEKEESRIKLEQTNVEIEEAMKDYSNLEKGISSACEDIYQGDIELCQALALEKNIEVRSCNVKAPYDGAVVSLSVKKGQFASLGDTNHVLFADITNKMIEVQVSRSDIANLSSLKNLCGYAVSSSNPDEKIELDFFYACPKLLHNKFTVYFKVKHGSSALVLEENVNVFLQVTADEDFSFLTDCN